MCQANGLAAGKLPERFDYQLRSNKSILTFAPNVVAHLISQRQTRPWHKEAGGQLFGKVTPFELFISEATGPRPTDVRTRTSYKPDRVAEQNEINVRHAMGLTFIGDWHSHPEKYPEPSGTDTFSMIECFRKSKHDLNFFVLVIVGQLPAWDGNFIGLYSRRGLLERI
jgi:integrative and conjugative element protein (TIGR02256 family)